MYTRSCRVCSFGNPEVRFDKGVENPSDPAAIFRNPKYKTEAPAKPQIM